eukprot:gene6186-347_t
MPADESQERPPMNSGASADELRGISGNYLIDPDALPRPKITIILENDEWLGEEDDPDIKSRWAESFLSNLEPDEGNFWSLRYTIMDFSLDSTKKKLGVTFRSNSSYAPDKDEVIRLAPAEWATRRHEGAINAPTFIILKPVEKDVTEGVLAGVTGVVGTVTAVAAPANLAALQTAMLLSMLSCGNPEMRQVATKPAVTSWSDLSSDDGSPKKTDTTVIQRKVLTGTAGARPETTAAAVKKEAGKAPAPTTGPNSGQGGLREHSGDDSGNTQGMSYFPKCHNFSLTCSLSFHHDIREVWRYPLSANAGCSVVYTLSGFDN